jgi:NitT/TauT family transport system substrate-binding protein
MSRPRPGTITRRRLLRSAGAAVLSAGSRLPAFAGSPPTKVRAGYVHALAVDAQIWLAHAMKLWGRENLDMQLIEFATGIDAFQAMTGGSLDVLATGAVVSWFPAAGRGKLFLINDIEYATAQLWCYPQMGIEKLADLVGKKVSTTFGTTAHIFLDTALRTNGIDPKQVLMINQRIDDAVRSFILKAVPAVALWIPHDVAVREQALTARVLASAAEYYPKAAIVDGWAARNAFYVKNKDVLVRIIRAWAGANDFLVEHPDQAVEILHDTRYPQVSTSDLITQLEAEKVFSSRDWVGLYADGTVANWLQRVSDFYVRYAGIRDPVPASQYFDAALYLDTIGK